MGFVTSPYTFRLLCLYFIKKKQNSIYTVKMKCQVRVYLRQLSASILNYSNYIVPTVCTAGNEKKVFLSKTKRGSDSNYYFSRHMSLCSKL